MAYFPDKTAVKTELQEQVNKFDLSCKALTTATFFEPNIAYIRDNTTREKWKADNGVFARPMPLQMPVMGSAKLTLSTYFVPYRVLSPQWHDFITRTPHIPSNTTTQIHVDEMPYFTMIEMQSLFKGSKYSSPSTTIWDFKDENGNLYVLTAFGRRAMKVLHQLKYKILWGHIDKSNPKHYNALRLLAFAKVYSDYYYTSQYQLVTGTSIQVESFFKRDDLTPFELKSSDLDAIFEFTARTFYDDDYFTTQWDNPVAPNNVGTSFGTIQLPDITMAGTGVYPGATEVNTSAITNKLGTPLNAVSTSNGVHVITQYAIDSLKKCTDYVHRYALSGVRSVDRYLARFGVLLTDEKMKRSEYYGKQETIMQFGAVYSTAETGAAAVGDYAGQGIINSDGQEHKTFEMDDTKDLGCIIQIFTIRPDIGYCQGMDRNNLRSDPESYFNGIFDSLGTQATAACELYVSEDGTSAYSSEQYADGVFGYIARGAHNKLSIDNCSGDFMYNSMNGGNYRDNPWHMFRLFDDAFWQATGSGVVHSPFFVQAIDGNQFLRIFNNTNSEHGDHFVVLLQNKIDANIHAKPIWDTYDFESEGKRIIMDGLGAKQH